MQLFRFYSVAGATVAMYSTFCLSVMAAAMWSLPQLAGSSGPVFTPTLSNPLMNSCTIELSHGQVDGASYAALFQLAPGAMPAVAVGGTLNAIDVTRTLRGNTKLVNVYNSLYTGEIMLGTPPRPTSVIMDTGSANLWTLDTALSHSTSLQDQRLAFGIEYGSGSVSGSVSTDDIVVGHIGVSGTSIGLVSADKMHVDFQSSASGIMGLAFRAISVQRLPTVLDDMWLQHPLMPKMFAFYLTRNPGEVGSKVVFGDVNHSPFTDSAPVYAPVVSETYWTVGLEDVGVNDVHLCGGQDKGASVRRCTALIDSGTSFIGVFETYYQQVMHEIGKAHSCNYRDFDTHIYLVCDCTYTGIEAFPTIKFRVAGETPDSTVELDLTPADYVQTYPTLFNNLCIPLILPIPPDKFSFNEAVFVMGMPVLRAYYSVFDLEHAGGPRIGFAPSSAPPADAVWFKSLSRRGAFILLCILQVVLLLNIVAQYWRKGGAAKATGSTGSTGSVSNPLPVSDLKVTPSADGNTGGVACVAAGANASAAAQPNCLAASLPPHALPACYGAQA